MPDHAAMALDRWSPGDVVLRREVLGPEPVDLAGTTPQPWRGRAWLEVPVHVVEDSAEQLITYIAPGAEFHFPPGRWPSPDGLHPWRDRKGWEGHGCLMVQRPGDHHAVWHFWDGPDRNFACWYINLQTAFRRTAEGYETQDLELDLVVAPDGTWTLKDDDLLDDRVTEGRFTPDLARWIRELADQLMARLEAGDRWWDDDWSRWTPPPDW